MLFSLLGVSHALSAAYLCCAWPPSSCACCYIRPFPCRSQQPLIFLRNKGDGSASVFLGKDEMKRLVRGVDALAFDEASKTLALLDRPKATIKTHKFN